MKLSSSSTTLLFIYLLLMMIMTSSSFLTIVNALAVNNFCNTPDKTYVFDGNSPTAKDYSDGIAFSGAQDCDITIKNLKVSAIVSQIFDGIPEISFSNMRNCSLTIENVNMRNRIFIEATAERFRSIILRKVSLSFRGISNLAFGSENEGKFQGLLVWQSGATNTASTEYLELSDCTYDASQVSVANDIEEPLAALVWLMGRNHHIVYNLNFTSNKVLTMRKTLNIETPNTFLRKSALLYKTASQGSLFGRRTAITSGDSRWLFQNNYLEHIINLNRDAARNSGEVHAQAALILLESTTAELVSSNENNGYFDQLHFSENQIVSRVFETGTLQSVKVFNAVNLFYARVFHFALGKDLVLDGNTLTATVNVRQLGSFNTSLLHVRTFETFTATCGAKFIMTRNSVQVDTQGTGSLLPFDSVSNSRTFLLFSGHFVFIEAESLGDTSAGFVMTMPIGVEQEDCVLPIFEAGNNNNFHVNFVSKEPNSVSVAQGVVLHRTSFIHLDSVQYSKIEVNDTTFNSTFSSPRRLTIRPRYENDFIFLKNATSGVIVVKPVAMGRPTTTIEQSGTISLQRNKVDVLVAILYQNTGADSLFPFTILSNLVRCVSVPNSNRDGFQSESLSDYIVIGRINMIQNLFNSGRRFTPDFLSDPERYMYSSKMVMNSSLIRLDEDESTIGQNARLLLQDTHIEQNSAFFYSPRTIICETSSSLFEIAAPTVLSSLQNFSNGNSLIYSQNYVAESELGWGRFTSGYSIVAALNFVKPYGSRATLVPGRTFLSPFGARFFVNGLSVSSDIFTDSQARFMTSGTSDDDGYNSFAAVASIFRTIADGSALPITSPATFYLSIENTNLAHESFLSASSTGSPVVVYPGGDENPRYRLKTGISLNSVYIYKTEFFPNVVLNNVSAHYRNPRKIRDTVCDFSLIQILDSPVPRQYSVEHSSFIVDAIDYSEGGTLTCPVSLTRSGNLLLPWKRSYASGSYIHFSHLAPTVSMPTALSFSISNNKFLVNQFTTNVGDMDSTVYIKFSVLDLNTQNSIDGTNDGGDLTYKIQGQADSKMIISNNTISYSNLENCVSQATGIDILVGGYERSTAVMNTKKSFEFFKIEIEGNAFSSEMRSAGDSCGQGAWVYTHFFNFDCTVNERSTLRPKCLGRQISLRDNSHTVSITSFVVGISSSPGFLRPMHLANVSNITFYNQSEDEIVSNFSFSNSNTVLTPSEFEEVMAVSILFEATGNRVHHSTPFIPSTSDESENTLIRLSQQSDCSLYVASNEIEIKYTFEDISDSSNVYLPILKVLSVDHQMINTTNYRVNTPMSINLLNNKVKLPTVYKLSIFDLADKFPTLDNLRVDGNSVFALYPQPETNHRIWQPEMFLLNFQRIESTISISFPLASSSTSTTTSTNNGTVSSSSSSYPIFSISDNFYSNQMVGDQSPGNGLESLQIQSIFEAIVNLPGLAFTAELEGNVLVTQKSVRGFFAVSRNNFDLPEIDEAVVFSFPSISSNNIAYLNLELSSNIVNFRSVYRSTQALSDLSKKLSARYSAISLTAETRSDLIIFNNTVRATNMNNDFITTLTAFDVHLRFFEAPSFYIDFSQNTIQGFIEPSRRQEINIYGLKLSKSQSTDSLLRVADFNLTADGNYLSKKSVMNSIVLNAHLRDQNKSIVLDCTLIKFDFKSLSWGSPNSIFASSSSFSELENRQAVSTENNDADNLLLRRMASFLNISNNYAFHEDSFTNISFSFLKTPSSPNIHLQQMAFERNLFAQEWTVARGVLFDYIPEKDVQGRNPRPQVLRVFGETRMFKNSWNKINDARSGLTMRSLVYDDAQYFGGFFAGDMSGEQQDEFPLDFEGGLFIDANSLHDVSFELFTWRKMIDVNVTITTTFVPTSTNNSSLGNDTITNTTEDPNSSSSSGSPPSPSPSWRIERIYAPITPSNLAITNFTLFCNHPENYWPSYNFTSMTLMYFPNTHFNFLACPYTPTKTLSKTIPPPTRTPTRSSSPSPNITQSISSSLSESHVFSETDNISASPSSSISISDELSETDEESHTDELTPSRRTHSLSKSVSENSRSFSEGTESTTPELSESPHRVSHTLDSTETRNSTPSKSHSETDSFYETPEKTAMQLAREVLEDVAAGASLLTIPAPTVAFGVARQQSMQQLLGAAGDGKCGFDIIKGERLPWSQSPTQLEVPAAGRYRFVVGAVVGNIALTLGLNVLFLLIGILYHAIYGQLNWMPMLGIATQAHLSAIFVVFVAVFYGSTLYHALSLFFDPYTRQEDLVLVGCMGVLYLLYIVVYLRKTLSNPELWANIVFEYETVDLNPAQSVEEKRRRFEKEEARKIAEHEEEERKRRRLESLDLDQLLHLDSSDDDDLPPVPGSPTVFVDVDALEQTSSDDDDENNNQQQQPRLASTTTTTTNQNHNDDVDDDLLLGEPQSSPSPEKPSEENKNNKKPKEKKKKNKNKNKSTESISSSSDDDLDAAIKSFVDSQLTLSQRICLRFRQIMSWWFGDLGTWRYTKNATRHQRLLFHFSLPVIEGYTSTAPRFILFELALQTIFAVAVIAGELLAESPERSCKAQGMIMALGMGGFLAVLLWLKPVQPRIAHYTTLICVFLSLAIVLLTTIIDPQHGMIEYFQIVLMVSETLLAVVMFIWFCHRIYLSILRNKFLLSSSVNHDGSSDRLEKFKEDDSRRAVVSDILTRPIFRGVAEDPPKKHFSPRPKSTDEKLKSILSSGDDKKTNKKKNRKRKGKRPENNDRDNDDENNNDGHQGNYYQPPSVERFHDENDERDDFNDATELLTARNFNQQDDNNNFSPRHGSMDEEPFNKVRVEASVNNNNNNNYPSSPNNTNKKVQFKFTTFDDIDNELRQAHKAAEASTADLRRLTVIENMSEHEAKAAAEARALEQIDKIQRLRQEVDKMTEI